MRDLEKAAGSVVGTLMKRLNYIGRRTAVAMVVIAGVALMLSLRSVPAADSIHCKAAFQRTCRAAECSYFPARPEYDFHLDGRITSNGKQLGILLGPPEDKSTLRWRHRKWSAKLAETLATLEIASDNKSEIPSFFSLTTKDPVYDIIGFCN